jgi:uncharacterized protein GlcG (DUF336 family)
MTKRVDLDTALRIIDSSKRKAHQMGLLMNIAVVDEGNNLVAFERMDGAWLGSISIAMDKAYTARSFNMATKELTANSQPGKPLFGINTTNNGRIVIFAGGIPLNDGKTTIGAIGVSGGTPDQDHEVADAGVKSFQAVSVLTAV